MRVIRIENKQGKGFLSSLPTGEVAMNNFYKSNFPDIKDEIVSCFFGGCFPVLDGFTADTSSTALWLTEIQLIQLYFISTSYKLNDCFYADFYDNLDRFTAKDNQIFRYALYNEFEFIDILKRKGFKLYKADIPSSLDRCVLKPNDTRPSAVHYETIVFKQVFDVFKWEYQPKEVPELDIIEPFKYFKTHFCGGAKGIEKLQVRV